MTNVLIAVPCYRGALHSDTARLLAGLSATFAVNGIGWELSFRDITDVYLMRNYYGSLALSNQKCSHLLFIDNDMGCRVEAIVRALHANKDVIGVASPMRKLDLERFATEIRNGADVKTACARSLTWNYRLDPGDQGRSISGIAEVTAVGCALMLIKRSVFEIMAPSCREEFDHRYQSEFPNPLYGFFDKVEQKSEDISFCLRWRNLGGAVFAITDETVAHHGSFAYEARLADAFGG